MALSGLGWGVPVAHLDADVQTTKIVYWEEDGVWLGYVREFSDYWTQGDTLDDLRDHLRDLYTELIGRYVDGKPSGWRLGCRVKGTALITDEDSPVADQHGQTSVSARTGC